MLFKGYSAQLFDFLLLTFQLCFQILNCLRFLLDLQSEKLLKGPIPLKPHITVLLGEEGNHLPELLSDALHLL